MSKGKNEQKVLAQHKKAFHDYEILEEMEAGIVLTGPEVKSIRRGRLNLKGSYVAVLQDEAPWVVGMHVTPYSFADNKNYEETRRRKLLLNRQEIDKLERATKEAGVAIVPTRVYLKNGMIKMAIAIARGKKSYDKRHDLKKKAQQRDIDRSLKNFR